MSSILFVTAEGPGLECWPLPRVPLGLLPKLDGPANQKWSNPLVGMSFDTHERGEFHNDVLKGSALANYKTSFHTGRHLPPTPHQEQ